MDRNNRRILAAEFVGTAVLVMCGPGSAILAADAIGILGVALAFGLSLLVMAYVIGPISGCHINPAVTLGMLLTKKIDTGRAVFSWIGQFVGGFIGALIIFLIANSRDGFERGAFAANGWDRDGFSSLGATIMVEIVFTALLVWVVLSTTSTRFTPGMGGLVVGFTLTLIHLVTIPVDNTSVNPARSLATALFADTDPNALGQVWAFIIFPLVGSVVGVLLFRLVDDAAD
jgi:aquaporin Z